MAIRTVLAPLGSTRDSTQHLANAFVLTKRLEAHLDVFHISPDPRDSVAHTAAIIEHLPEILADERGSLVLFSSRKQMLEVLAGVPAEFRRSGIRVQNILGWNRWRILGRGFR